MNDRFRRTRHDDGLAAPSLKRLADVPSAAKRNNKACIHLVHEQYIIGVASCHGSHQRDMAMHYGQSARLASGMRLE